MDPTVARILDANFNRAREALRVMEDFVRFVRNDPGGCAALKRLRHEVSACMRALPAGQLLAGRDTPADVGTNIKTPSEQFRLDAWDVFTAAAKRLPEALRTLEEYAKTFDVQLAARLESLRYRAYDLEQRLACRGDRAAQFARTRLYVLISEALCAARPAGDARPQTQGQTPEASPPCGRDWLWSAQQAVAGGADCIQLREKGLEDGELLGRARELAELCRRTGVLFIVNDRPDIAVLADADGVHLGQTDLPPAAARRILGPDRLIGVSTHDPAQLRAALAAGPDYIAVGPMFQTSTKPQSRIAGPELLALALRETEIPVVPIGGITAHNAGILVNGGARRVCVCSAVIGAADPQSAARTLFELVPNAL